MDAEAYPQEVLADEEPKYLRRQKPLEIKRRKFGRKAWKGYLRVSAWVGAGLVVAGFAYISGQFLLHSPAMALLHPEQIRIAGNHFVQPPSVLGIFAADRNRSVLRIPLNERRRQIESLPWVEQATVRRALPNHIEIEIVERTPIAFLRDGSDMSLVDVHGMILERPLTGNFHFPVVSGVSAEMPIDERERRMELFAGFSQQIQTAHAGAMEQVSEVDLSDAEDLRATLTGLPGGSAPGGVTAGDWGQAESPLLVHFGDSDFEAKYRTLLENIGQWRATAGRVESVDLRFSREAVVNPDNTLLAQQSVSPKVAQKAAAKPATALHDGKKHATSKLR
ncbi:MAG TPA: FtsQ-type POTRA domain-containing protein [Terriglobales bacterium]|nr:FtsQ-type POTRA domain-containing protein [Terriglobales bacterium]